jgi:hypothetical protein
MTDSLHSPGWKCPNCGAEHLYDCPNLGPVSFLEAVMHDPTVAMRHRLHAADKLMQLRAKGIYSDDLGEVTTYVIPPLNSARLQ